MDEGNILRYCCPSTVPSLWPPSPSPPSQRKCTVYTDSCVAGVGVGGLNCTVDHILQELNTLFLTRFRTYRIVSPPQTKMTSKDDIKGLVSLKFLCPWSKYTMCGFQLARLRSNVLDLESDYRQTHIRLSVSSCCFAAQRSLFFKGKDDLSKYVQCRCLT